MNVTLFRRAICFVFITALLLASLPAAAAAADQPQVSAGAAALYHPGTDTMLFEKQADERVPVAFLAKVVTAMIAAEQLAPTDMATVPESYKTGVPALSAMQYQVGETISVEDLLYAVFVQSADEAANILAAAVSGDIDAFIKKMNDYAAGLGATDTLFTNTHGVYDGEGYTTARDAVKIITAFSQNETLMEISDATYHRAAATNMTGERDMYSTNSLIHSQSSYYDGRCVGVKNDYSDQGGYSLATVAKSGEMEYICVLFGAQTLADDRVGSYVDATAMLDWALENFQVTTILQKDDPCAEIPVELCKKTDKIVLLAAQEFTRLMPVEYPPESLVFTPNIPESLTAPVAMGDEVGTLNIAFEGETLGEVPIVAGQDAPLDELLYYTSQITGFFNSPVIKAITVVCLLIVALYIFYVVYYNRKRKKYKKVKNKQMNRKK